MLRFIERRLVFPGPTAMVGDWNPDDLDYEDVELPVDGGVKLHGWYVPHSEARATALYCHGNGVHVAFLKRRLKILHERFGLSVLAWDYRGYGKSEGVPHESNVVADASVALRWLADRDGIEPGEVFVIGRSLGGAVGTALAAREPIAGLVLDRTFARLTDVAAYHFPWLPVKRFLSNKFSSVDYIQHYRGPLMQSHGTGDDVVPFAMGRELFDAAPSEDKQFIEVPGLNHDDPLPEYCYRALDELIDRFRG